MHSLCTDVLPPSETEGGGTSVHGLHVHRFFCFFLLTRPIVVVFIVLVVFTISLALFGETTDI